VLLTDNLVNVVELLAASRYHKSSEQREYGQGQGDKNRLPVLRTRESEAKEKKKNSHEEILIKGTKMKESGHQETVHSDKVNLDTVIFSIR